MSDTMTWTVNGTARTAPAGLLPEGILGAPDATAWAQRKLAGARRFTRQASGRERDLARLERRWHGEG